MKKLSEMYKLYRELPLFSALYDSMLELVKQSVLPETLVPEIVHTYDQKVMEEVKDSKEQYSLVGKMVTFRILEEHQWFVLSNVTVYRTPLSNGNVINKKGKKVGKMGRRVGKFDKLKMWAYDPIPDASFVQVNTEDKSSPYVIEIEKVRKVKAKKPKLDKKKVTPEGSYNPLIHTSLLGIKDGDMQKQDYSRPMPYNEKLRRARNNPDDVMAIAKSQVGTVDLLKSKYRKKMREYPYRCVEPVSRKRVDLKIVSGRFIAKRQYMVLMRSQDRFLSEMTVNAGGSLALMAHNIHVAEDNFCGEDMETVRESYGTRRKNKIEHSTFDTIKNYSVVEELPKKRIETDSESYSSDEEKSDYESSVPQLPVRISKPESRCRPKSKQENESIVKDSESGSVIMANDPMNVSEQSENLNELLDDLVEMMGGNIVDGLELGDENNNEGIGSEVVELGKDEDTPRDDVLHTAVLDLFNSQQNIFPDTSFSELNQTLDTEI